MTKYSISAANRITGKSRTTISKHLASGKLSCSEDEQGNKLIDASELMRVYGAACDFSREEGAGQSAATAVKGSEQGGQLPLSSLAAQLEKEIAERERERAHYRQQIDHLQDALKLAQEGQNKAMLLLEHRTTGGGEWQAAIKQLEEKWGLEVSTTEARLAEVAAQSRQAAYAEIRSRPWWHVFSLASKN